MSICAGDGRRWGNYLGVPKYFVTIDGKRLLHRTVDQFQGEDIYIVASSIDYQIDGTILYISTHNKNNLGADKLLNSSCLWSNSQHTLLLFGDVYFTDEAVQIIKGYINRCQGWEIYRAWAGGKPGVHRQYGHFIDTLKLDSGYNQMQKFE